MAAALDLSFVNDIMNSNKKSYTDKILDYIITNLNSLNAKDNYTARHSLKVGEYSLGIAAKMGLAEEEKIKILIAGVLHDIGKIMIPNSILKKTGRLNEEEFKIIKSHSYLGYEATKLFKELSELGIPELILYHHERVDGKGYPLGVTDTIIPIGSRIISAADSYDAMTTTRTYRIGFDHYSAVNELITHSNAQFDRNVIYNIFLYFKENEFFMGKRTSLLLQC